MTPNTTADAAVVPTPPDEEIRLYGHGTLFYWWPVWAVGFLMALLTYLDGNVMAIVPEGSHVEQNQVLPGEGDQPRDVLVTPPGKSIPPASAVDASPQPRLLVSANNNYGVVFIATILLVALVSNFILRGLASVVAVTLIAVVVLLVALMGWWDDVLGWLGGLDVRMNAGGYLALAVPLFALWLFSTFVYDHYTYVIITRGQVRVRQAIGDSEQVIDSSGLVLTKERNDLFRHLLIGLGSGDLHIKTGGPAQLDFELYNVLFIDSKLGKIQDLLREKEVAAQTATA